jgi:hypothetical protein
VGIKHAFTNPKSDGTDTTVTRPSDWNADHTIADGTITAAKLAAGVVQQAVVLYPTKDGIASAGAATTNYGTGNLVVNDFPADAYSHISFLSFDLTGLTITSLVFARLQLMMVAKSNSTDASSYHLVRRCLRADWVESEMTWTQYKSGSNWTTGGGLSAGNDVENTIVVPSTNYIGGGYPSGGSSGIVNFSGAVAPVVWDLTAMVNRIIGLSVSTVDLQILDAIVPASQNGTGYADRANATVAYRPQLALYYS